MATGTIMSVYDMGTPVSGNKPGRTGTIKVTATDSNDDCLAGIVGAIIQFVSINPMNANLIGQSASGRIIKTMTGSQIAIDLTPRGN